MTLDNLVGINLERVEVDNSTIQRLLDAAARNIKDAKTKSISNETRFDAAYKAIMQMANAALQSNGYRTLIRIRLKLKILILGEARAFGKAECTRQYMSIWNKR